MAFIICAVIIVGILIILKLCKEDEPDDTWLNYKPKSTYDLLLERKEWKECREWVFSNKGKFCCNCHSTNKLQIHHKFYFHNIFQ